MMDNPYLVAASTASLFGADAISADTRAVNADLDRVLAELEPPADLEALREAYVSGRLGLPASPPSPRARTITIDGPAGPIGLRIVAPDVVRGVYLHAHGGGWMAGSNAIWDDVLELIADIAGLASVSIDYRLAPEHPFPAAADDCLAAADWLIEHGEREFGTDWFAIGGESAGSHLAALTLLRLRDRGAAGAFRAANLLFGCFDLSLTPSMRNAQDTVFVTPESMAQFIGAFAGQHDLRDPALSPLYADLTNLPPALFTVGSIDPLLDDSLFMHARWQAAGNVAQLAVYPGGVHGFNILGGELAAAANDGMAHFLAAVRDSEA